MPKIRCPIGCGKSGNNMIQLKEHMRTHIIRWLRGEERVPNQVRLLIWAEDTFGPHADKKIRRPWLLEQMRSDSDYERMYEVQQTKFQEELRRIRNSKEFLSSTEYKQIELEYKTLHVWCTHTKPSVIRDMGPGPQWAQDSEYGVATYAVAAATTQLSDEERLALGIRASEAAEAAARAASDAEAADAYMTEAARAAAEAAVEAAAAAAAVRDYEERRYRKERNAERKKRGKRYPRTKRNHGTCGL